MKKIEAEDNNPARSNNLKVVHREELDFFKSEVLDKNIQRSMETKAPNQLFGDLFFENELGILFGDTGSGKSILAMQLSHALGNSINTILTLPIMPPALIVLYIDFELSPKQREMRYTSSEKQRHSFGENVIICEIDNPIIPEGYNFETYFTKAVEQEVLKYNADVVIIDNITFLSNDLQKGNKALELMKLLKNLKRNLDISLLILAHVPKRDDSLPITKNDLSGSKNIANFADSIFAIGTCFHDANIKYIKQIKERAVARKYGAENVIVCEITESQSFLSFSFIRMDTEHNMLLNEKDAERLNRQQEAKRLKKQGLSTRKIAKKLGVSHTQIANDIKKHGQKETNNEL